MPDFRTARASLILQTDYSAWPFRSKRLGQKAMSRVRALSRRVLRFRFLHGLETTSYCFFNSSPLQLEHFLNLSTGILMLSDHSNWLISGPSSCKWTCNQSRPASTATFHVSTIIWSVAHVFFAEISFSLISQLPGYVQLPSVRY